MVDIILDTNVWISQIAKDEPTGVFELLKSQIEEGKVNLLTNDIIIKEWHRNRLSTSKSIIKKLKSSSKNLLKIKDFDKENEALNELLEEVNLIEQKFVSLTESRLLEIDALLKNSTKMEITNSMKIETVNLAIEKKAPFINKANSVGDALILLSAINYREKSDLLEFTSGFFVTFNHKDFASESNPDEIHSDLKEELDSVNLKYKRHLGDVLEMAPELYKETSAYIDSYVDCYLEESKFERLDLIRSK